nr:GAF domain-containing protein [Actinoplanes lichenis]
MLSTCLTAGGHPLGALNIYARTPGALDDTAVLLAESLAGSIAIAMNADPAVPAPG